MQRKSTQFIWIFILSAKSIYQEIRHADEYMIELIMVDWTDNREKTEYEWLTKKSWSWSCQIDG
jgi:hypothetical protein